MDAKRRFHRRRRYEDWPRHSIALLVIQLALVSSIAAKYLYQRWTCPRVWTRAVAYDPELLMRGRYLSLQLTVDGCQSTLPSAKLAAFPRNIDGTTKPTGFSIAAPQAVQFPAQLKVENNRLVAIRIQDTDNRAAGHHGRRLARRLLRRTCAWIAGRLLHCRARGRSPRRSSPARSCGSK